MTHLANARQDVCGAMYECVLRIWKESADHWIQFEEFGRTAFDMDSFGWNSAACKTRVFSGRDWWREKGEGGLLKWTAGSVLSWATSSSRSGWPDLAGFACWEPDAWRCVACVVIGSALGVFLLGRQDKWIVCKRRPCTCAWSSRVFSSTSLELPIFLGRAGRRLEDGAYSGSLSSLG